MWRKIRIRYPPQPASQHRTAKRQAKRFQPPQAILSDQHKRATVTLAAKTRGAIEQDLERLGPHFCCGRARRLDIRLGQTAEKEQRNMQPLRRDQLAAETMRPLENAG
jgi:hypothetical protein